jgi:hypothetical protein
MFARIVAIAGVVLALTAPAAWSQDSAGADAVRGKKNRMIMTWVPPYGIDNSWAQLRKKYGGAGRSTGSRISDCSSGCRRPMAD